MSDHPQHHSYRKSCAVLDVPCGTCFTSHMSKGLATTGLDLKLARVAARVKQRPLADAMGVSESRVSAIEREAVVSPAIRLRYLDALARAAQAQTEAA